MNDTRKLFAGAGIALSLLLTALASCTPSQAQPAPFPTAAAPVLAASTSSPAVPGAVRTPGGIPVTGTNPTATPGGPANSLIKVARIQGFGLFLTDDAGRTLYAFANDTKDTSNCSGDCARTWPPFIAPGAPQVDSPLNAALVTMVTRQDGTMQVSYDGHPLYYYSGDKNSGDVKGHGLGEVWHVLSPRGSPMTNPPPPTATFSQ
jgi:predicted lipoprotein with Yx(FWY)xxD motif